MLKRGRLNAAADGLNAQGSSIRMQKLGEQVRLPLPLQQSDSLTAMLLVCSQSAAAVRVTRWLFVYGKSLLAAECRSSRLRFSRALNPNAQHVSRGSRAAADSLIVKLPAERGSGGI